MKTTDTRVRRAIAAVGAGRPVVITTGPQNNHEGYLAFAAEAATPQLLAFTVRHTSGYVRVGLRSAECERLDLPPICHRGDAGGDAGAHRVAVDWRGTGTGISATDRSATIAALATKSSQPSDFRRPGHVVTVEVGTAGVLGRPGPAEAALDLTRLAGRREAAGFCDIVSHHRPSAMARGGELLEFALEHALAVVSVAELVSYRRRIEPQVVRMAETVLPNRGSGFRAIGFRDAHGGGEHLALVIGDVGAGVPVPLHVHVECLTSDVFGSTACRCGAELDSALSDMRAGAGGVVIYLRPPGPMRACGLTQTEEVDSEQVSQTVAWILRDLGVYTVRLTDDAPGFGLVIFGAIRERGLRVAG
ncbi:3,4-dihydroxy-2-butanone-4-phosphate synthase [Mycolicibacterium holsaticum]|uniref:3,4-dihydroxy-2-butanone-4-phosphate synthase n=1 Tax=Mycolicibacterium holsaticum TaxID=152142 RepID=UPI001C7DD10F|nr:3,4-dihydroxy-2-butanone-4-phosphate synthase [Mycolicibacterium holsaticum]MDA4109218.1 riboflavin biosynthesis protein RibA [Mycolicibacterium holsaticum DSM 44478 = JCM 12374]QZA11615.1 3,4-dihydroxy-2-butanone-4-phosphate synthase [Mycolicibacterium holsaticum DSM 44478 = JCM 12374]UNC10896.1 3,4-dihydroxy-2-butanone-4-phosphate synthase [Mycolicibacterium holsaticum DSM 44478 = JCM 12374]